MNITIEYCTSWGYLGRAVSLGEVILKEHKNKLNSVILKPSDNGAYEVYLDDELIFSKLEEKRYPGLSEVESKIRSKIN